ncbi:MAG: aconitate hydratase [Betaproteobacteria bacterium SG8_41]|nr:MAG: aconitate hydratase [Betaproteobacteria bacterium SG8_41]
MTDLQRATLDQFDVDGTAYCYHSLPKLAAQAEMPGFDTLPFSLRILAENLLRHAGEPDVAPGMLEAIARGERGFEIPFRPARVLLQDGLGVPAMVDLAALRDAIAAAGGDPLTVNPRIPVDFVIDHSLVADVAGAPDAARRNIEIEYARNRERFAFLAWCQGAFRNVRVVPPDSGIVHQLNVERFARVVWSAPADGGCMAYPDTVICNDSHTPMVNGIGVVGWGVGGIEAEAAMLGHPLPLRVPEVVGVRVSGALPLGATATDLVLTITELLRRHGVVGKFVEFFGPGLDAFPVADRVTVSNMAPEYGATCVFFPLDEKCLDYLALTGRDAETVALARAYTQRQGLWRDGATPALRFDVVVDLDLARVERCIAGPRRPQDRVPLEQAAARFKDAVSSLARDGRAEPTRRAPVEGRDYKLGDGDVVIAAITSCTNTSNPANMIAAGLLARNAVSRGLASKPWVKTSLAPGSKVVMAYLERAGLVAPLEKLGFHLVGFGCTTCNGNSGPLAPEIEGAVTRGELVSVAVLSGNRNFEGRVHPLAQAAYLASPPLVVAYAIAGTMSRDLSTEPLGSGAGGEPVHLKDVWPDPEEVAKTLAACVSADLYRSSYEGLFEGAPEWRALRGDAPPLFPWQSDSTFLRRPPFFDGVGAQPAPMRDLKGMRVLAMLGDMVTTDHMSPSGAIPLDSPTGRYLTERGLRPADFQSYVSRRGNHEVGVRSTFGSARLKNKLVAGQQGAFTRLQPEGKVLPIYDAAEVYRARGVPLIVIAGRDYGAGSSRDWAAKGPALLGVRAVLAQSFERIHRSNLVGMGVLPLEFREGDSAERLGIDGTETFDLVGLGQGLEPLQDMELMAHRASGAAQRIPVRVRIDTPRELEYFQHGGILPYVLRDALAAGRRRRG